MALAMGPCRLAQWKSIHCTQLCHHSSSRRFLSRWVVQRFLWTYVIALICEQGLPSRKVVGVFGWSGIGHTRSSITQRLRLQTELNKPYILERSMDGNFEVHGSQLNLLTALQPCLRSRMVQTILVVGVDRLSHVPCLAVTTLQGFLLWISSCFSL